MTKVIPFFQKILKEVCNVYKKFIFILFVFILIFINICSSSFADGGVLGLTYNIPESPDYPNHTYIFIYERFLGGASGGSAGDGIFMLKYYMPIVLEKRSDVRLQLKYINGLHYRYNTESDEFEPVFPSIIASDNIHGFYYNEDKEPVPWNDPDVFYYGFRPLASNHNIYLDDDTLFFWTPQMSTDCPHLYRPQVMAMVKTLLVVGGRTLGIALAIFGIVLGISSVKRWIFSFLR
jgi:hypothetical protein